MTEVFTYRRPSSGIWNYEFRRSGAVFGNAVSYVVSRRPAMINGPDLSWYSMFDMDSEIVPGLSRKVMDSRTGGEVFRIIWWGPNLYEVRTRDQFVTVEIRNGSYLFGIPKMPVTAMAERLNGEPPLRTLFFDPVTDGYMLMALAFPVLRFC